MNLFSRELSNDKDFWEFIFQNRITPDAINSLGEKEIFVFGTDPQGNHNSLAGKLAVEKFGAKIGKGEGLYGQSYAIPVHRHRTGEMYYAIRSFIEFAEKHTDMCFLTLPIGCGKAGMEPLTVANMFRDALRVENIFLPKLFVHILRDTMNQMTYSDLKKGKLLHCEVFGQGLYWELFGDGTLEVSGIGAMPDYKNHWDSYWGEGQPKWVGCERYGVMPYRLIIGNGITRVGDNAFESFGCLKEIFIGDTVTSLGKMAFFDCFNVEKINIPHGLSISDFDKAELPMFYNKSYVRMGNWLIDKDFIREYCFTLES